MMAPLLHSNYSLCFASPRDSRPSSSSHTGAPTPSFYYTPIHSYDRPSGLYLSYFDPSTAVEALHPPTHRHPHTHSYPIWMHPPQTTSPCGLPPLESSATSQFQTGTHSPQNHYHRGTEPRRIPLRSSHSRLPTLGPLV